MLTSLSRHVGRKRGRLVSFKAGQVTHTRQRQEGIQFYDSGDSDDHQNQSSQKSTNIQELDFHENETNRNDPPSLHHSNEQNRNQLPKRTEKGISHGIAKTFDFLKEKTEKLFDTSIESHKTDWTAQQLVTEWLRLFPTLSSSSPTQQRDAIHLADMAARNMIQGPDRKSTRLNSSHVD